MKKLAVWSLLTTGLIIIGIFLSTLQVRGQETLKVVPALPEEVNKIVVASCTPCHTNEGKLLSRSKLNFEKWTDYSAEKQKERAAKMYSELNKGAMPPKAARQKRPDLIPTTEQIAVIKKWSESFKSEK